MTDEEVFERLVCWALTLGCDVVEVDKEDFQAIGHEGRRGVFRRGRCPGTDGVLEIVLQTDLPVEESLEVLGHEVGHMALYFLGVEPYQRPTHEVTASVLGTCLIAVIREDYQNPLFKIGGIVDLVKEFLTLLKGKQDRTARNFFMMGAGYLKWKEEVEGGG